MFTVAKMAHNYRKDDSSPDIYEKGEYDTHQQPVDPTMPQERIHGIEYQEGTRLHRGLKSRQVSMIAVWLSSLLNTTH